MQKIDTPLSGCFILQPRVFEDARGRLVKTYHENTYRDLDLGTEFGEEYYSISAIGVLRGLHFQVPPHAQVKCVTCIHGKIFDAVVDLRKNSPTYKQSFSVLLDSDKATMLYVPEGFAHGLMALTEKAVFLNRTSEVYNAETDMGIRWDSCGISWPMENPILSEKDKTWMTLSEFDSPF
jgi:dTDP-4-dehydrorhamnose 3,5-epimerase